MPRKGTYLLVYSHINAMVPMPPRRPLAPFRIVPAGHSILLQLRCHRPVDLNQESIVMPEQWAAFTFIDSFGH